MKRTILLCCLLTVLGFSPSLFAGTGGPTPDERRGESGRVNRVTNKDEIAVLRQLVQARKAGDRAEMERLQNRLTPWAAEAAPIPAPEVVELAGIGSTGPSPLLWDQDVLIRSGSVGGSSIRGLCTDNDQDGNLYVGLIDRGSTADTFWVYKSTNDGAVWQFVNGFYVGGRKLQSVAMHITDSAGVRIVGMLGAAVTAFGRQDGTIYWVSFNEHGSGFRATNVAAASGGYGYNNVSVVSDGFDYSPGVTWWFGAAAHVDSAGGSGDLVAFRSQNWGASWPLRDTLRYGYGDLYPTIDYEDVLSVAEYHSTEHFPIHDLTSAYSSIYVDANTRIGAIHVQIDSLVHSWDADIEAYLFTPWGDSVELFTDVGGSSDNFIRTLLTDSAVTRITAGTAPFTGAFKPEATNMPDSTFSSFYGRVATGTWTLRIYDDAASDTGQFYGWSLWIDPRDVEQVYVSGEYTYSGGTEIRVFRQQAAFGGSSGWDVDYLTNDGTDKDHSDFAVDWRSGEMGIVWAQEATADRNLMGLRSINGGLTFTGPVAIASSPRTEAFCSIDNSSILGDWRLAYVDGGDSVMYRSSSTFSGLAGVPSQKINDNLPTPSFRPEVGVHGRGYSSVGHVVYAGFGPQNVYYDAYNNQSMTIALSASWNLLSNPMHVADDSVHALFPSATYPYAFAYDSATGYQQEYRMANRRGYWTKFPAATSHSLTGLSIDTDSIPVRTGWNLIGTVSWSFDTSWVVVVPPGNRASLYFGYAAGYSAVQTMVPGQGYWVKMSGPGYLLYSLIVRKTTDAPGANPLEGFGELRITDATGAGQTLFLGSGDRGRFDPAFFAMPPRGPEGVFDARFASGALAEVYGQEGEGRTIDLAGAVAPLTVTWQPGADGRGLLLSDGSTSKALDAGGRVTLGASGVQRLFVSTGSPALPREFALLQNHPNPFNPVTVISYTLPAKAQVTLTVFNLIGQEVATLVREEQPGGVHEAVFDGAGLGSGVYFYRIEAGTFSATRKMLLLK